MLSATSDMKLTWKFSHALSLVEMRRRIEVRVAYWHARHPSWGIAESYRWVTEDRAEATARGGSGWLVVSDTHVELALELPFIARPFRSRIESLVRAEADEILRMAS